MLGRKTQHPVLPGRVGAVIIISLGHMQTSDQTDATLTELRERLGIECSLSVIWMALNGMRITSKEKRPGPPSTTGRMWWRSARSGGRGKWGSTRDGSFSLTKPGPIRR
jgi:hypothetical protein